jgi:hypothetical protein
MTLKGLINDDVDTVFLNSDEFAETVTFYPGGASASHSHVLAVVIWDELEGTRESHGDGVTLERDQGTAVRQSVKLEMSVDVAVDDTRRPADLFKLADGTMVAVKRIIGKDNGMQTVLCTRRDNVTIRRPVKSG